MALRVVKVTGLKLYGRKYEHAKGWCGLGWVWSPGVGNAKRGRVCISHLIEYKLSLTS